MRKLFFTPLIIIVLLAVFIPGIIKEKKLVIGGSTSVYPLFESVKSTPHYKKLGWKIYYNSIGSASALKHVKDGIFDVGFVSRALTLTSAEKTEIQAFHLADDYTIMLYNLPDGCILKSGHKKNVKVTKQELKRTFLTKEPNWTFFRSNLKENYNCNEKALNRKITRINRENGSGTRQSFEIFFELNKKIINYNFDQQVKSSNQLLKSLRSQKGAITYVSLAFLTKKIISSTDSAHRNLGIFIFDSVLEKLFTTSLDKIVKIFSEHSYSFTRQFWGFYLKSNENTLKIKKFLQFLQSSDFKKKLIKENRLSYRYEK